MLSDWLWNRETGDVCGETVLFTESESAVLAFPAEEVTAVYNPTLGAVYAEGRDFRLEQGGRVLRRLPGSTMPFLTREWLYPSPERAVLFPDEGANAIGSASGSPTGLVCFDRRSGEVAEDEEMSVRKEIARYRLYRRQHHGRLEFHGKGRCCARTGPLARTGDGTAFPADLLPHGQRRGFRFRFGFRSGTS